jgi:glutathione S-transferase
MHIVPATILSAAVTILAVLFYFYTSLLVGQMRGKHDIKAPAVTGNIEFECAYRVQMNTLEHMVIFLPLLWIATIYFMRIGWIAPLLGLVWIVGRFLYMTGYMRDPSKRSMGFLIAGLALVGLLILSIVGVVNAWIATSAM